MKAAVLTRPNAPPVFLTDAPPPPPAFGDALLRVLACGVCRTDLHIVDGELPPPRLPLIPGHQIVAVVEEAAANAPLKKGDIVGVPWLARACGKCAYCAAGRENLCDSAEFTGFHRDGGFAEFARADAAFCHQLPAAAAVHPAAFAPLLCAGLIGYRALRMCDDAHHIGIYGFGAAAHILAQILRGQGRPFCAFTRKGADADQKFALELGAQWAGDSQSAPPEKLDAAIIFAPAGEIVPCALAAIRKGGAVICAGIHMSDIPSFPYALLWGERVLRSVANLTREDGRRFFAAAAKYPIKTAITEYPLTDAARALDDLRNGKINGAAVLRIGET
jgi:propanol-preferring alcohol dehydrogenase